MKIKLGQCRCMAIVYMVEEAGLTWTADMEALDAQGAVAALTAGRELYRIRYVGKVPSDLSTARPDVLRALSGEPGERPVVVPSHGCPPGAVRALVTPLPGQGVQPTPQRPPVGQQTPFSGPLRAGSSVPSAAPRRSDRQDHPRCDDCGAIMGPGEYTGVQIGTVWVWAQHELNCGKAGE